jgi:gentisate 1,2-dioxygenase
MAEGGAHADFYARIAARKLLPLWIDTERFVPAKPTPPYAATVWHYDEIRPFLIESGGVVTPEQASRRVLVLQNPALDGAQGTTRTLYACLQLILPGETAPEHRHTLSALRLILEGEGAYTTVDGERVPMGFGDFIITPAWSWHGHGHDGDKPMVWLDGLDNGLMLALDTTFFEPSRGKVNARPELSDARYGANMLPMDRHGGGRLLRWPFAASRAALAKTAQSGGPDPCDGYKSRYIDPATGGDPLATIACFAQLLPTGFKGRPHRTTEGAVFVALEGEGRTIVGSQTLAWRERDVFVVPSWAEHRHEASSDAVLFSFSDRGVQEKLGVFREER